jgi:LacI family transcriptional regulator
MAKPQGVTRPEPRQNATLADVAARAGVSPMTVSRVVNDSERVSASTRERVELAMSEIGYIPNFLARGLVVRRLGLLALIVADITHPWFTSLAHSVEVAAGARGYTVVFGNTDDDRDTERTYLQKLSSLRVEGVIIAPAANGTTSSLDILEAQGIPFVQIDREIAGASGDLVRGESFRSARLLTDHLAGHGRTRIAIVSGPQLVSTARERVKGFRAALKANGLPVHPDYVRHTSYTREGGYEEGRRLLSLPEPPTAIVAANSFLAFGILDVARELGVAVPDDLALVTFDDLESTAVEPFLTCVEQPAKAIGLQALELLTARLDGDASPLQHLILDGEFRVRRSCGCQPDHPGAGGSPRSLRTASRAARKSPAK